MTNPPVVAAIDFGGSKIAVAVCDLTGNRLASGRVSARSGEGQALGPASGDGSPAGLAGARAIFDRGVRTTRELLATAAPGRELAAVGVATFGIPAEDQVLLAPAIDGWESLALGRELRAAFPGAQIKMATDVKAAAAAEYRWGALRGCDPGVYLNLGTGLAAAIVAGGQVLSGEAGAAGEIGYNLRAIADVGLGLGQRVPLEDAVSGLGLARQVSARGLARPPAPGRCPRRMSSTPASTIPTWPTWPPDSSRNWRFTWLTWPSASTRRGSRSAVAWPVRGPGCSRTWSAR